MSASARSRSFIVPAGFKCSYFTIQSTLECKSKSRPPAGRQIPGYGMARLMRNRIGFDNWRGTTMTRLVRIVLGLAALIAVQSVAARAQEVDLLLVLASDVSRSVDTR